MAQVTCRGCRERDEQIEALERRVVELEALIHDLTPRVNNTNSGTPPSANPPFVPDHCALCGRRLL
jgi:hypothetical protein